MAFDAGALIARLELNIDGWKAGLATVRADTTDLQKRAKETGASFERFGKNIMPVSAAISLVGGVSVKAAMELNQIVGQMEALGVSKERALELKRGIQDMAAATGKSTTDIATGVREVISTFEDSADTMKFTELAAKAGAAGIASTQDALNLMSSVMKGYNDISDEAAQKTLDLAFQTYNLGQTTFPELAGSMGDVIPIAAALGAKQEELFAVMATTAGVTGSTAEASTQLKSVIMGIVSPTEEAAEVIKKMGYASGEAMVADLGLVGAVQKMVDQTDRSSTSVGKLFSNVRALPAVMALTGNQAKDFENKLRAMQSASGAMDKAFVSMTTGVNKGGFEFKQLVTSVQVVAQKFGDALSPAVGVVGTVFGAVVKVVGIALDLFNAMPGPIKAIVGGFVMLTAGLGPMILLVGKLSSIFAALPIGISMTLTALAPLMLKLAIVGAVIAAAKLGTDAWNKSLERQTGELVKQINTFATANTAVQDFFRSNSAGAEEAKQKLQAYKAKLVELGDTPQEAYRKAVLWLANNNAAYKDWAAGVKQAIEEKNAAEKAGSDETMSIMARVNDTIKKNTLDEVQYARWKAAEIRDATLKELTSAGGSAAQQKQVWTAYYSEISSIEKAAAAERDKLRQEELEKQTKAYQEEYLKKVELEEQKRMLDFEWQQYMAEQAAIQLEKQGQDVQAEILRLTAEKERQKAMLLEKYGATAQYLTAVQELEASYQLQKDALAADAAAKEKKLLDDRKAKNIQVVTAILGATVQMIGQIGAMQQQAYQNRMDQLDQEYEKQKEYIEKNITNEDEKTQKLAELETWYSNEKQKLRKQAAAAEKRAAVFSAIINTASAIVSALQMKPFFPMGLIAAATAATMGALQVAAISSQPEPFAEGGYVDGPVNALVGEAGPEVITPLPEFERMMGISETTNNKTINLYATINAINAQGVKEVFYREIVPLLKESLDREYWQVPAKSVSGAY